MMSAAARRSSIRELVQEPRNTVSTRMSFIGRAGLEPHVLQGAFGGGLGVLIAEVIGRGHLCGQRHALAGVGSPRHERFQRVGVEVHLDVERCVVVGVQRVPVFDGGIPVGALSGACGRPCM